MTPVLVLSGHVASLAVARSLASAHIPVFIASYDPRDMAPSSRFVRGTWRVPYPQASEEEFLCRLEQFSRSHERPVLMPADDPSLVVAARHHERLGRSFVMACPERTVVERVIDKRQTYAAAAAVGLRVPTTIAPRSARECADAGDAVGYPCIVKPATSHLYFELFGVKYRRVIDRAAARAAFDEADKAGIAVMVQEWIAGGDEYGVNYNAYAIDGRARVEFTARKLRMAPPGGGVPTAVVSESISEVLEPGRLALAAVGLTGFACCEFKWDARAGAFTLLEVNARHNRSGLLAPRCGINFPLIDYEHRVNAITPGPLTFTTGRYWVDEFKDLAHLPRRVRMGAMKAVTFWRPYVTPPVCAVFDWRDLGPFVHRLRNGLRMLGRELSLPWHRDSPHPSPRRLPDES